MNLDKLYAWLWITWIAAFFAIELTALFTGRPQFTLSWFTWRLEDLGQPWTFTRYFIAAFLVWLLGHIIWGAWR